MPDIVLATVNAKYIHTAFGLRYLQANLGPWREHSTILEFGPQIRAADIVEQILEQAPRIVGLGMYIWNTSITTQVVAQLKSIAPQIKVVLGGPEISYETDQQPAAHLADYVVIGEGEAAFLQLVEGVLRGRPSLTRVHQRVVEDLGQLQLPYQEYSDDDIENRVVYVEASRGCPFRCSFCLSSLDKSVRSFPLDAFLSAMKALLDRGVRRFKFVDRTFNLSLQTSGAILDFFWQYRHLDLFLHFEMIPDRLPEALRDKIARFAPGTLQFEVGIQSFHPEVNARIQRRQKVERVEQNLAFLREHTGVHVHADLIIGLPGEPWEQFCDGLDRLITMGPQEIQVGVLKRLRGTPLTAITKDFEMQFDPNAPYEILCNRDIDFSTMQQAKRMALVWDKIVNQGHFPRTVKRYIIQESTSPSRRINAFARWVFLQQGRVHGFSLEKYARWLCQFLVEEGGNRDEIARVITEDLQQGGQRIPAEFTNQKPPPKKRAKTPAAGTPPRQRRHLSTGVDPEAHRS